MQDVAVERVRISFGGDLWGMRGGGQKETHRTICLRRRSGLRMNLRVRRVTGPSDMMAVAVDVSVVVFRGADSKEKRQMKVY